MESGDVLFYARALYPYTADTETEISFNEGDVIAVTADVGGGWWQGTIGEYCGNVPANYFDTNYDAYSYGETETTAYEENYTYSSHSYEAVATNDQDYKAQLQKQVEELKATLEESQTEKHNAEEKLADLNNKIALTREKLLALKQERYLILELKKLEAFLELNLDRSMQLQHLQIGMLQDISAIKTILSSVKIDSAHRKSLDEVLGGFEKCINTSSDTTDRSDKVKKKLFDSLRPVIVALQTAMNSRPTPVPPSSSPPSYLAQPTSTSVPSSPVPSLFKPRPPPRLGSAPALNTPQNMPESAKKQPP